MQIIEKFREKSMDLKGKPPVTIAFLGDSVTQGCFDLYEKKDGCIETYFSSEDGYPAHVKQIMNCLFPSVPLNIINAGISGDNAVNAVNRLDRDVLRFVPDLCVVCFGLNDCNNRSETAKSNYRNALQTIFTRLTENECEAIFMTPNYMCTDVSEHIRIESVKQIAQNTAALQNTGRLEDFLSEAKTLACQMQIPVCDCYAKWKLLDEGGVNINNLLANYVNHPLPFMHWMFANALVETMFKEYPNIHIK